jgi:hypothetical protein
VFTSGSHTSMCSFLSVIFLPVIAKCKVTVLTLSIVNTLGGGWMILGWILERWDGVMWTGLVWLRKGTGGELL